MKYKKGTFITVPNRDVLFGIKGDTQSVYIWICRHADDDGICFPSINRLAKCSGVSKSRTKKCIKELEEKKLITKEQRKNKDNYKSNLYQIQIVDMEVDEGRAGDDLGQEMTKGRAGDDLGVGQEKATKETHNKDTQIRNAKALAAKPQYGDPYINNLILFFKEQMRGGLDGTQRENRRYACMLINKMKKDYAGNDPIKTIKALIIIGLEDEFHGKNATGFKYLYYNCQRIIQSYKKKQDNGLSQKEKELVAGLSTSNKK